MSHTSVLRVAELHDALKHALAEQSTAHAQQQAILKQLADVRAKEQAALHSAQNILSSLKCMRMTLSALQATQIGVTVSKLRKSDAVAVASISAELIKSWKAIAECGGRGMEGDGVVDRSGKSPTKAAASSSSSSSAAACSDEERTVRSVARLQDRYAKLEEQKNSRKSEPREPFPGDLLAFLPRCCADVRPSYQCSPRPHSPCTRRQGGGGAPEEDKEVIDESRGESEPRRRTVGRPNRIPAAKNHMSPSSPLVAHTSPRDRRRNGKAPFAPNATFVLFNIKLI